MRIVSLCPSLTELVFDLGRGGDLMGITEYCTHPTDRVESVEKVGGPKNPKIERILELRPDLVLLNEEENRREDAEALTRAGVPHHVSFPKTPTEAASMVRSVGKELAREEQAEVIARDIEGRLRRVSQAAARYPPVSWAYLIWRKPWMAASSDTFISGLLISVGGVNVFGDRGDRYPEVSADEIAAARPAVVLLATEPFPFDGKYATELAEATGLPRSRFRIVDGRLLSWHGSCTPRGIDYAAEVLRAARVEADSA